MSRRLFPFPFIFVVLIFLLYTARSASTTTPVSPTEPSTRSFEFTYQVHFPATENPAGPVRLWIPLPQRDGYQDLSNLHIESAVAYSKGQDSEYKDAFAEFRPTASQAAEGFDVTLRFSATRHEHKVALDGALNGVSATLPADPMLHRYLEPDKLVPLNGVIGELAKEHTAGDTTQLEKARHIYDFVVSTMRYDKSGEGWGHGDAVWACTSKRGNCTDFHSLFIGMMRASGMLG
jgi:transglutaminase-like putative cysteine protease